MKFTKYTILLIGFIIISSCSDEFLELEPKGSQTEATFYENEAELFQGLIAAYDPLAWGGAGDAWSMPLGLLATASDECYAGGSDASDQPNWVAYDNFSLDPDIGPQAGLWNKYYGGIAKSNLILEKLAESDNIDDIVKERYEGEAKFLRAYYYFDLIRFFDNVVLTIDRLSPDDIQGITQSPKDEVYNQIINDLKDVYNNFSIPSSLSPDEYGRVSRPVVTALLAKVLLYTNDNTRIQESIDFFEEIINSGQFDLEPDFGRIFAPDNEWGIESIWEINHSGQARAGWEGFSYGSEGNYNTQFFGMRDYVGPDFSTGWSFCPVTLDLVNAMTSDPRFEHTIIDGNALRNIGASYTEGFQNTDYFIRKYAGLQENVATDGEPALNWGNNEIVIRFADILLMAAEAHIRAGGDDATARQYLNRVRSRVGLQPITSSGQSLLDAIYRERRLELATEGHRFFDLVRTGQAGDVLENFQVGKNEVLPIPQREIDLTQGALVQNPGY